MPVRTPLQKQRRAETERRRYTQRRLKALRAAFPDLPANILESTGLRQLSACARKSGAKQGTLSALFESSALSGPSSKDLQESVDTTLSRDPSSTPKVRAEDASDHGGVHPPRRDPWRSYGM